ncbi:hypothetical protein F5146DRAFT_378270 [Armillaria mellea]|nr:hypothetical protein F5146DRAFT_378270 [Armillaria mellea]
MSQPLNIPGHLSIDSLMAQSGNSVPISQSNPSSMKLPDVQIEQMSPEVLAEFFINSLPQYRPVVTVLADFTRVYRMNGKAFLAISRNDIETLLQVQAPSVVDALTGLQEAATGQQRPERRPKLQLTAVFHDLEGRIPSAREINADGGSRDELSALEGHDEHWVFNDELTPPTDSDILFSSITGVPAEEDRLATPSAPTSSSSPRSVPIIFDSSPDMTSPSTFISPQTVLNSRDAEFLTAHGGHTYPGMPKEEHEESQITDMAGSKLILIDETLSYGGPIDPHDATVRNSSSVPETEEFRLGNITHLGTGVDRCIDISSGKANRNESLSDWIDPDHLWVFGGQDIHEMKASAEVGQSASSIRCSSYNQLSSTPQNNSNDPSRLTGNLWLAPPIELSNNSSLPQKPRLPSSPTSDEKDNSSFDRCEDYGLNASPHGRAIEQHALVISEHGSRDSPNQLQSPPDTDEQIKGNSPSSYKSDGLANIAVLSNSPPFFDDIPLSSSSSREPSDSARYIAAISSTASATKGSDDSPVTISPTGINASYRIAAPCLPSQGFPSKNAIHIAGDIASRSDADAVVPPIAVHASINDDVESAEHRLGGPIWTTDSETTSPNLDVTKSFHSPDAPLLSNFHPIVEDLPEDNGFALIPPNFSASTGDIFLESGSWIVIPRPSTEVSHHSPPLPEVYPAPVIPPIEALRQPSVENNDVASVPAAGTAFTHPIQGLPEILCVPLFQEGELELGLTTQTVRSRGAGKESATPSHKWETDERPFFGQSHASPSFLEQRISKSRKGKGKERNDATYQDKVIQTDTPPVDPSVEDPQIVQLSRKANRLQEEVATLKAENENLKRQTLWSKFFSRPPVKEVSSQPTSGNGRDVIRISTFPDLRFVTA